jgi:GTP-binding protein
MTLTVAIVGRPNVGKSTLFNRLVGRRVALVDDSPGVTRDRREGTGRLANIEFVVFDTAGLEQAAPRSLGHRMQRQTQAAIAMSDVILFLIDARAGILPDDRSFAHLLHKAGKPTILIANKSEGRTAQASLHEASELGFGEPVAVSAEHGEGLSDLYAALQAAIAGNDVEEGAANASHTQREELAASPRPIHIAIVGRPNCGKSTLVNRLLGEERLLTGPEPGLTRDAIAVDIQWHDQRFRIHDTAGLRRRSRVHEKLEKLSVADALNAIRFAEVVVLLLDAQHPFEEQDLRLADLVEREGRAIVIAMNKCDLVEPQPGAMRKLREETDRWLPQVRGVPVVRISGLTGAGIDQLMGSVVDIYRIWNRRLETSTLNRWLAERVASNPPPAVSGRRIRLDYITQPKTRPPTFVLFTSRSDAVPQAYRRHLINGLRESFSLPGIPIRLTLREKKNPYATRKAQAGRRRS